MAWYKDNVHVVKTEDDRFDRIYPPGTLAPYSGIYRCDSCNIEAVSTKGHPLPPVDTHPQPRHIPWRLLVMAHFDS